MLDFLFATRCANSDLDVLTTCSFDCHGRVRPTADFEEIINEELEQVSKVTVA
jgi:hypothetical protein